MHVVLSDTVFMTALPADHSSLKPCNLTRCDMHVANISVRRQKTQEMAAKAASSYAENCKQRYNAILELVGLC